MGKDRWVGAAAQGLATMLVVGGLIWQFGPMDAPQWLIAGVWSATGWLFGHMAASRG